MSNNLGNLIDFAENCVYQLLDRRFEGEMLNE